MENSNHHAGGDWQGGSGRNATGERLSTESMEDSSHSRDLLVALNRLLSCQQFTDVTLCVGQEELHCHKVVLAGSSPYFQAMFSGPYLEQRDSRVVIDHISPWTMKRVLEFVYTGRVEVSVSNVQDLLAAAGLLEYPALVGMCASFMRRRLDVNNCLGVEHLAEIYQLEELKQAAHSFAAENFTRIVEESPEWTPLSMEAVQSYLMADSIDVKSEEIVFNASMKWINHDLEERTKHLSHLLSFVRLPHLTELFLRHQLAANKVLQESPKCVELVRRALKEREVSLLIPKAEDSASNGVSVGTCSESEEEAPVDEGEVASNEKTKANKHRHRHHKVHASTKTESPQESTLPPRPSTVKKEMLMILGGINTYILNCMEIFHPGKASWSGAPPIPESLTWFSAAVLGNDIYVTGGIQEGRIMSSVFRYSAERNSWSTCAPLPTPRARHASAPVGGHLFLLGGVTTREDAEGSSIEFVTDIERYDPVTDSWAVAGVADQPRKESVVIPVHESEKSNECHQRGNSGRVLGERTLLEVGGTCQSDNRCLSHMAIYRVRNDLSVLATSDYIQLPKPIRHAKCVARQMGTLLYILWEDSGDLAVLNLARNSIHFLSSLQHPRLHCGMACVQNKIYVVGGFKTSLDSSPCSTVSLYDPRTDQWTNLNATPSTARGVFACLTLKL